MVWNKPKYVVEDVDRYGKVRIYFRRKGLRKILINAMPDTQEFWEAYSAATQGRPLPKRGEGPTWVPAREGTLRWLCQAYFASAEYRRLDPSTQLVRRRVLEGCLAEPTEPGSGLVMADCPVAKLTSKQCFETVRHAGGRKHPAKGAARAFQMGARRRGSHVPFPDGRESGARRTVIP